MTANDDARTMSDWYVIGMVAAVNYDTLADFVVALALSGTATSQEELMQISQAFIDRDTQDAD